MTKSYVRVLKESLCRKKEILKDLISCTENQKEILESEEIDWELFDEIIDKKSVLIDELERLDEGFDQVFARVKDELTENPDAYAREIADMKGLISDITSLSGSLESMERRNKAGVEKRVMISRKDIRKRKVSAKAATVYYQNTKQLNLVDPQLMDKKN